MKTIFSALALTFALAGAARAEDEKSICEIVENNPDFSMLKKAVMEADLAETLKGDGPFTVFAPTDAAFKKIPKAKLDKLLSNKMQLKRVLMAHVVPNKKVMASDVKEMDGKMVKGHMIKCEGDKCMIGDATVKKADIMACNGVIHVIDTVLMPAKKKNKDNK